MDKKDKNIIIRIIVVLFIWLVYMAITNKNGQDIQAIQNPQSNQQDVSS